jgi:hypothetical protein
MPIFLSIPPCTSKGKITSAGVPIPAVAAGAGVRRGNGVGVAAAATLPGAGGVKATKATDEQSKSTPKRRRNGNPFNA